MRNFIFVLQTHEKEATHEAGPLPRRGCCCFPLKDHFSQHLVVNLTYWTFKSHHRPSRRTDCLLDKVSYRPDLSGGVGVLPRQAEVQHVALPVGGGESAHGEVGLQNRSRGRRWDRGKWSGGAEEEKLARCGDGTGLMSRCRKPTEWMASMDSRICFPSRSVVLMVKVPRGWLLRRSARFRPCRRPAQR